MKVKLICLFVILSSILYLIGLKTDVYADDQFCSAEIATPPTMEEQRALTSFVLKYKFVLKNKESPGTKFTVKADKGEDRGIGPFFDQSDYIATPFSVTDQPDGTQTIGGDIEAQYYLHQFEVYPGQQSSIHTLTLYKMSDQGNIDPNNRPNASQLIHPYCSNPLTYTVTKKPVPTFPPTNSCKFDVAGSSFKAGDNLTITGDIQPPLPPDNIDPLTIYKNAYRGKIEFSNGNPFIAYIPVDRHTINQSIGSFQQGDVNVTYTIRGYYYYCNDNNGCTPDYNLTLLNSAVVCSYGITLHIGGNSGSTTLITPGVTAVPSVNLKPLCDTIANPTTQPTENAKCNACVNVPVPPTGPSGSTPIPTGSGGIWTAIGCVPTNPIDLINGYVLAPVGLGLVSSIAFLYFLYGSFLILTSAGNAEKINQGKEIMTSSIAGLLLIIFSVFILRVVGVDILRIPDFGPTPTPPPLRIGPHPR